MSRKDRYMPMNKRLDKIAQLIDQRLETNDPAEIAFKNGLETALAIVEQREPILTEKELSFVQKIFKGVFN